MADAALMPFPLRHELVSVEAVYKSGSDRDPRREVRKLGYFSEAIQRIRTGFKKIELAAEAGVRGVRDAPGDGGPRPAVPGLEQTILGWLRSTDDTWFDFSPDPEPQDAYLSVRVTMRRGDAQSFEWKLRPDSEASRQAYWKFFEEKRSKTTAVLEQITASYDRMKRAQGDQDGLGVQGLTDARLERLQNTIRGFSAIPGAGFAWTRGVVARAGLPLRVWGPVLKLAAPKVPKLPTGISESELEARKTTAATTRRVRDHFAYVGPIQLVSWHNGQEDGDAPSPLATGVGELTRGAQAPDVVRSVAVGPGVLDSIRMTPLYPVGVACSLGAFESADGVTERAVKLANNERAITGDAADIFKRLGIDHEPESIAALAAFSDLVVHMCAGSAAPFDGGFGLSVESCIVRAMQHAQHAASFVNEVCVKPDLHFAGKGDLRFYTMKGGQAAALAVRHLPCWQALRSTGSSTWSTTCRKSAAKFATMLARIATGSLAAHPTTFPFMATQALWTWPASVKPPEALTLQSAALEDLRRRAAVDDSGSFAKRADHAQFVAAKQSLRRVDVAIEALGIDSDSRAAHGIRRSIVLSRPSISVGEWSSAGYKRLLSSLPDGLDKQKELADRRTIDPAMSRASWARRSVGEFSTWHTSRDDKEVAAAKENGGVDGAIDAMARLAINSASKPLVRYHVPFGILPGRSPLSAIHLAFGETQVWLSATQAVLRSDVPNDEPDSVDMRINMSLCVPLDASIALAEPPARTSAKPATEPLLIVRQGTDVTVPVCVNAYDDIDADTEAAEGANSGVNSDVSTRLAATIEDVRRAAVNPAIDRPDRYRCIVYSTERIWQALTLAVAAEAGVVEIVIPDNLSEEHTKRLLAASILACGLLPRSLGAKPLRPRIASSNPSVNDTWVAEMRGRMQQAMEGGLVVASLSEMAATVALWSK